MNGVRAGDFMCALEKNHKFNPMTHPWEWYIFLHEWFGIFSYIGLILMVIVGKMYHTWMVWLIGSTPPPWLTVDQNSIHFYGGANVENLHGIHWWMPGARGVYPQAIY